MICYYSICTSKTIFSKNVKDKCWDIFFHLILDQLIQLQFSLIQDKEEHEGEIKLKSSLTFTCKITGIVNISSY